MRNVLCELFSLHILVMGKCEKAVRLIIIEKLTNGMGQRETSRNLGIPRTTVRNVWKRFMSTGRIDDQERSGRPTKLNARDRRKLVLECKRHPFFTARELRRSAGDMADISISSVKRILRKYGLHGRVAAKKPLLNRAHMRKRLLWCKQYLQMDVKMWQNFIFSDEARMELYCRRRQYVRRPIAQRFNPMYTMKTVKYGGPSVLVWGAIMGDGTKVLCRCPPILNSRDYQDVLDRSLIPFLKKDSIFMQDGAPCHRSRSTLDFLDSRNICLLSDWPSQSPDLNILENLWSVLKNRVQKRLPRTSDELWAFTEEEWNGISKEEVIHLFHSIPARLREVIRNKGHHIKY
jgi:transposase